MKNLYFAGISRLDYYMARIVQFSCSICSDAPSDQATPDHDNSVDQTDKEMYNWEKDYQ
jgi:hypothetical protein